MNNSTNESINATITASSLGNATMTSIINVLSNSTHISNSQDIGNDSTGNPSLWTGVAAGVAIGFIYKKCTQGVYHADEGQEMGNIRSRESPKNADEGKLPEDVKEPEPERCQNRASTVLLDATISEEENKGQDDRESATQQMSMSMFV